MNKKLAEQGVARQPAISSSISFQHPFNRAGGRTSNVLQEMKKALLIILPVLAVAVVIGAVLVLPVRFRLESTSPSGDSQVRGLRFKGQSPHALDGMLRLFVSHDQSEMKQQTSIPFGRDLAIEWKESPTGDAFVIERDGRDLMEIHIKGSALECTKGAEYLAPDPYEKAP